jgi:hypothetical protein
MKANRMKAMLESIAQRDVPAGKNLWPRIATKIEERNFMQTVHTRPALALLLVFLALILISGVAYAIGKITGYVPGVGIVDQSAPLRILAKPVVVQKDGLTVTVSAVIADSDHTFVAYTVDGIVIPAESRPTCGVMPALQLPNGLALSVLDVDDGGPQGGRVDSVMKLEQSVTYSSIPSSVNTVTFTFPCVLPEGTGPEDWRIPLKLSPASKGYATPAVEIGATFVASNPTFVVLPTPTIDMRILIPEPPDTLLPTLTPVSNGSGLYLEQVIELPNSYILVGNFTDAGDLPGSLEINLDPHADLPHIEDGSGKPVTFKVREDIQPENPQGGVRYWAYEIAKPVQGSLTITLDQINIAKTDTTQFTFDAGSAPQVGQKWDLNLSVHLLKYDYVIDSVEVIKNGYLFKYHSGMDVPDGTSPMFNLIGHTPEQDSSALNSGKTIIEYSEKLTYSPPLPTGQLTVQLTSMETIPLDGPWTLTWTPPNK